MFPILILLVEVFGVIWGGKHACNHGILVNINCLADHSQSGIFEVSKAAFMMSCCLCEVHNLSCSFMGATVLSPPNGLFLCTIADNLREII